MATVFALALKVTLRILNVKHNTFRRLFWLQIGDLDFLDNIILVLQESKIQYHIHTCLISQQTYVGFLFLELTTLRYKWVFKYWYNIKIATYDGGVSNTLIAWRLNLRIKGSTWVLPPARIVKSGALPLSIWSSWVAVRSMARLILSKLESSGALEFSILVC